MYDEIKDICRNYTGVIPYKKQKADSFLSRLFCVNYLYLFPPLDFVALKFGMSAVSNLLAFFEEAL